MRQAVDMATLTVIGWVNKAVFSASRGRVVLYRFHGISAVLLTITGPSTPLGDTVMAGFLADGDDLIVVDSEVIDSEAGTGLSVKLRASTSVTAEIMGKDVPVDVTVLTHDPERAALLERLLKRSSIQERHRIRRGGEIPIARLTRIPRPYQTAPKRPPETSQCRFLP
ncbi:hypothetical protein [Actinomadura sp. 9N407]|uniref:hypothetical protein n=1 Tax=Actinomadura sp. 9N407 TaxID=3375154 RepID=UPI0037A88B86